MLLWLWWRLAAAALIQPLDWGLPFAAGAALKEKKDNIALEPSSPFWGIYSKETTQWNEKALCMKVFPHCV